MTKTRRLNVYAQMDLQISSAVRQDGQEERHVFNSTYESDKDCVPINNLAEVAVEGKVVLVGYRNEFWGGKKSRDYYSPVLKNPTWLQVCVHANRMICRVRDFHHVYLEGLERQKGTKNGVPLYEFLMGS